MNKNNIVELEGREAITDSLTELLREGARDLIQQAVEAELTQYLQGYQDRRLEDGRAAVVRHGYQPERDIQTGIGPVTVKVPKVRPKDGNPVTFLLHWYHRMCGKHALWKLPCRGCICKVSLQEKGEMHLKFWLARQPKAFLPAQSPGLSGSGPENTINGGNPAGTGIVGYIFGRMVYTAARERKMQSFVHG